MVCAPHRRSPVAVPAAAPPPLGRGAARSPFSSAEKSREGPTPSSSTPGPHTFAAGPRRPSGRSGPYSRARWPSCPQTKHPGPRERGFGFLIPADGDDVMVLRSSFSASKGATLHTGKTGRGGGGGHGDRAAAVGGADHP
eukprot:gene15930-53546_t